MDLKFVWLLIANLLLILLLRFTRKRKTLNNVLTVGFMILITLTVLEGGYRLFFKKKGFTETGNFGGSFNTPVALTGFTIKNISDLNVVKKDPEGKLVYDAHYSIIPDSGFNTLPINHRKAYQLLNPLRDSVEVVFLGCSFTFGTGVPDTATMAYRVGKQLDYNSINFGGSGFGTHQAYQIYTHKYASAPDRKKRIFVYTFIPDHLLRAKGIYTWCLNDPYFDVKGDSLQLLGPAYKHSNSARSQVLVRALSLNRTLTLISDIGNNIIQTKGAASATDDDYKRIQLMLEQINKSIQAKGDQLLILHWDDYKGSQNPKGGYYVSIDKINGIVSRLHTQGAHSINVSSFFNFNDAQNTIPQDNHPSIKGNALMADAVVKMIHEAGY